MKTNISKRKNIDFFEHLIEKYGGAIALHEAHYARLDAPTRAIKVLRHMILYAIDAIISLFVPERKILSAVPLETYYAKHGRFEDHPLVNFLRTWNTPSLQSTYFALAILDAYHKMSPSLNFQYGAELMRRSLMSSYDPQKGTFVDQFTRRPDYGATIYAIRAVKLLEDTECFSKEELVADVGIDVPALCDFLLNFVNASSDPNELRRISPNFSIIEKALSSMHYLDSNYLERNSIRVVQRITDYLFQEDNKIAGFRLHKTDSEASVSANKSGVILVETKLLPVEFSLDVSSILRTLDASFKVKATPPLHSELFLIFNALTILDRIERIGKVSRHDKDTMEQAIRLIDSRIPRLVRDLCYKGGFMFNSEYYSAPNLYASRLFVEILSKRGMLDLVDRKKLEGFILDSYDFYSQQFRNYPYRSWYYARNYKMGKEALSGEDKSTM